MCSDPARASISAGVVVCTYNGANYLQQQLQSLLSQSHRPSQVVIADDASTDGSVAIIQAFADEARTAGVDTVVLLNARNKGFIGNFSDALGYATTDVVFLCDQDDIWHRDKIEVMRAEFAKRPDLTFLHADARLVSANLDDLGLSVFQALALSAGELAQIHSGDAFDVLLRRSAATGATSVFRRELITLSLPVPDGWIHDEWMALVASMVGRVDALERPVIDYRQHAGNQIGARRRTLQDRWVDLVRSRRDIFRAEIARMDRLEAWVRAHDDVPSDKLVAIEKRLEHFRARLAMGAQSRFVRPLSVRREWTSGNYARFSNGSRSVLRDLLRRG